MGFKLKFPKYIWNAHDPLASPPPSALRHDSATCASSTPSTESTSLYSPTTPILAARLNLPPISPRSLGCKVKLHRFHHGGPLHARRGRMQNDITLEMPCFKITCENCWFWHWRGMRTLHFGIDADAVRQIDPRILDGSWRGIGAGDAGMTKVAGLERSEYREEAGQGEYEGVRDMALTPVRTDMFPSSAPYDPPQLPYPRIPVTQLHHFAPYEMEEPVQIAEGITDYIPEGQGGLERKGRRIRAVKLSREEQKLRKKEYDRRRRERMKKEFGLGRR